MILSTAAVAALNRGVSTNIFPGGIPSNYSWYAHGSGPVLTPLPAGWTEAQMYSHIFVPDGTPNPAIPANILMRRPRFDVRQKSTKKWFNIVIDPQPVVGGHFWLPITPSNQADPLSCVKQADGSWKIQPPTLTRMSHFWTNRGEVGFLNGDIDAVFVTWDAALDAPGRYCFGLSNDWWSGPNGPAPSAATGFTNNQGSGSMDWGTLDNVKDASAWGNYKTFVYTNLTQAQMEESLPPYFNGNKNGDGTVTTTPPPAGTTLLAANMTGDQGALAGASYNLWTNGKVGGSLSLPTKGTYRFDIVAHGSIAGGLWPNMNFLLDGAVVGGGVAVNTVGDKTYSFSPPASLAVGAHSVLCQFTNDGTDAAGGDRNLYITSITATLIAADGTVTPPPPPPPAATSTVLLNGVSIATMKSGDVLTTKMN